MLSRRPRVSSSSWLRYNESISVEIKDNVGVVGKRMESHKVGVIASPGLQASTETSTTSQCDNRMFGRSTRHVECNRNMFREEEQHKQEGGAIECGSSSSSKREAAGEEKSSDIKCNRVSNDISLAMSFTIQNSRRLTQRVRGSSRHRRRKSVEKLDRNVDVFQISCSKTNQRLAIDSNCSEITPCPQPSICHEEMQDFQKSARISDIDRLNNPSSSIYPKIPDKDKISRTRHEIFEARTRINYHRHDDTVMEHKTTRRRNSRESTPRGGGTLTRETERSKKMRTIWSQWACRKNRWIVILGLLMWTTLMITEVTGRQNHHRTCPGCPHQHVHTINRKSSSFDEDAEASSETETAPSPDDLRLEAIKHQILTKLGLRTRPDVNKTLASVPRHLALETLYRAEAQPPGHAIEPDGYHEGKRRDHRRGETEDEDSLSSPSSSSLSSSSSSLSSSKSSSSLSQSSSSLSSKSSSSSKASLSSSSSSYGQFYYDGEEYSYRNVDLGVLEKDASPREYEDPRESSESGEYVNNEKHRAHGDYRNGGKNRDYHVTHDDDEGQIEMDDFYARTSEIISFAEPGRTLNGQPLLEFPQSGSDPALEPLRIKRATLWARVEFRHAHHYQHHRRAQTNQRNITLWVFRVRCGNVTHLRGKELGEHLEMVTSLGVNVNQLGWQKFDVTKVVSNWYSGHELSATKTEKLTLLVDCTGCGSHVHVSTFGVQTPNVVESSINSKGGEDPDRPFLVVRTDPAAVKRVRRRAIECSGAIKGQCCKQRFYVSFSQLGWDDWIIAPQGYYANYCRGDCAAGHRTPDTFLNYYTHVIEEYRKMDRLAGMQPCCAPLKFSPMSLIYYGPDSNIIKRDLPKMVVDECGCP